MLWAAWTFLGYEMLWAAWTFLGYEILWAAWTFLGYEMLWAAWTFLGYEMLWAAWTFNYFEIDSHIPWEIFLQLGCLSVKQVTTRNLYRLVLTSWWEHNTLLDLGSMLTW